MIIGCVSKMLKICQPELKNCFNNTKKTCVHWYLLKWKFSEIFHFLVSLLLTLNRLYTFFWWYLVNWRFGEIFRFLVSLSLTLNRLYTLFWCFHCWLWTSKCCLCWLVLVTFIMWKLKICLYRFSVGTLWKRGSPETAEKWR